MRASCAYSVRKGRTAAIAAQIQPASRPKRLRPAQSAAGTVRSAKTTDGVRSATSLVPASSVHACSSR